MQLKPRIFVAIMAVAAITAAMSSCKKEPGEDPANNPTEEPTPDPGKDEPVPGHTIYEIAAGLVNSDAAGLSALLNSGNIADGGITTSSGKTMIRFAAEGTQTVELTPAKTTEGSTPVVNIAEDGGKWYWKVDGEWLKDSGDTKVPVVAEDGTAVCPEFRVEEEKWQMSVDGGESWADLRAWSEEDATLKSVVAYIDKLSAEVHFALRDNAEFFIPIDGKTKIPSADELIDFEVKNIGLHTLDVDCKPASGETKYTAAIFSVANGSLYDKASGSRVVIDYEALKKYACDQFKLSIDPNAYKRPYNVKTGDYIFAESELALNDNWFTPSSGKFAVVVAAEANGEYYISCREVEFKTVEETGGGVSTVEISNVVAGTHEVTATITATGAGKLIYTILDGISLSETNVVVPTVDNVLSNTITMGGAVKYTGPISFVGSDVANLAVKTDYYIIAIPVDPDGKTGTPVVEKVTTADYETNAAGSILTASFGSEIKDDKLELTLTVSSDAKKVRILSVHPNAFLDGYTRVIEGLCETTRSGNKTMLQHCNEYEVGADGEVKVELEISEVGGVPATEWIVWGCIEDEDGNISAPQDIAGLADGSQTASEPYDIDGDGTPDTCYAWPLPAEQ